MRRINILYIIGSLELAGTGRHLLEVLRGLDRNRFNPITCCLTKRGALIPSVEKLDVRVEDLDLPNIRDPKFFPKLFPIIKIIKKERIDIVHTYLFPANFFGAIFAKLGGAPVIITSRRSLDDLEDKNHIYAYRWSNFMVDKIVAVAEAAKASVIESEKVLEDKVITIHNGIDFAPFNKCRDFYKLRNDLGFKENHFIVGTVANIKPVKGYEYLLRSIPRVVDVFPHTRFVFTGEIEDEVFGKKLKRLARELNVSQYIIFTGQRQDIPQILQALDVFVLPSLSEGVSNSLLEAMNAGKPVIATRVGGNSELIEDGKCGLLVPPANAEALAQSIITVLGDMQLADRLGAAAKIRALGEFHIKKMISKMESLYEELADRKPGRTRSRDF